MNKKLFLLPFALLGLVACEPKEPEVELKSYEGATISTIAQVAAGADGDVFSIAGTVVAKYAASDYAGIYVANGAEGMQLYGYENVDVEVGDFVVATGARSFYKNGRAAEMVKKFNNAEVEGAGIVKYDLTEYDVASFGVTVADPVAYTFDGAAWETLTSSEDASTYAAVTGRKITVTGTVTGTVPTDTANNMTLNIMVGETQVAVYVHKSNDAAATREAVAALVAGDSVTVSGLVGSYKGSTQIVCIQSLVKNA